MVYIILIAYGGIIKWHRKVILDEEATALNLVPGKKELKYLGYSLLFGIVFVLIGLFVLRILAPAILGSGQNVQVTALTFAMLNKIYLFKLLGILICNAIFLLLIGKHLLRLPNLAVEGGAFDFSLFAEEKLGWIFLVLAGSFIIMLLHYCLFLLHFSIFSIEDLQQLALNRKFVFSSLNIVFSALSTFLGVYTALTYASLLSLFYREYR